MGVSGILYQGSAGQQDFSENSAPYTVDTFTLLASVSKLLSSTCMMQLVEKGLVSLDEDLRPHLQPLAELQILKGFDENDKPILVDNVDPITLRYVLY
jgi:CubicO group peptidase (beta-lactamase class C family)